MRHLSDLAKELQAKADPQCSLCHGAGQYLRLDKALMQCNCVKSSSDLVPTSNPYLAKLRKMKRDGAA